MNEIISRIFPGTLYDQGFKINGKIYPFYSFCQPNSESGWSDRMAEQLAEPSKNHFIDRYNRKIALDGIGNKLVDENCCYLDMGCSSGYMLEDVLRSFPKVNAIGADYFSAGLLQCHQRLPDIPLLQMDLVNCQFSDNSFDVITCLNVLEHINNDELAIDQLYRITKPRGVIVLTVPTMPNLYDMHDEIYGHVRRYKLNDLEQKICSAGFKILKSNYFGVFIYPVFYVIKKINKLKFDKLKFDEKKRRVFDAVRNTKKCFFLENTCYLEQSIGKKINYPFGFRGYVIATK